MTEQNVLFLAVFLMLTTTLVLFIWQFVRSRRPRDENERGEWYEGPWDDDEKR